MRLNNLRFPNEDGLHDLCIHDGKITAIQPSQPPTSQTHVTPPLAPSGISSLDLAGALAFPGLINSHDHLDFNLFPPLANKIYKNYTEWGPDIFANNKAAIQPILRIPQCLRTLWGIYKNLLNGFTTVVNHGEPLDATNSLITVFQDCYCLHSVGFEPRWKWKLNRPRLNWPRLNWARLNRPRLNRLNPRHRGKADTVLALHVGEGTDACARKEIDQLIRWNLFRRPIIGIHGVAMTEQQASAFRALVWCPASNYFLLDQTAAVDRLKTKLPILFGTDSTLTASWNHWTQIRMTRELRLATDHELLEMLTTAPAAAWGLKDRGSLAAGQRADLVIARPRPGSTGMDAFYGLNPEDLLLILHEGNIRLFDPSLLEPITAKILPTITAKILPPITTKPLPTGGFGQTKPGGKYVSGDLPGLMHEIRQYYPEVNFPAMP